MTRAPAAGTVRSVGVDTGGTFTDFVANVNGRRVAFKLPSTPRAPERAVVEGLKQLGVTRETRVRHGSTVATNALLERKGARVALVTTRGFEDLIEIGRQDRPDIYALHTRRTPPLVPAARRIGVTERTGPDGAALTGLTDEAIRDVLRAVERARPEAVALGLLHAYASPRHERRLARALRKAGWAVTVSSELCPEIREYERLSTTVVNAYLLPRVSAYVAALSKATPARVEIVLSHGGTAPPRQAAREPVRQLLSGPAAGVKAASGVAGACGFTRALSLDVGGTSTDCAFIDGAPPRRRAREIAGFPIQLPLLDVHTVGAGGGSIARVDAGGLLHVGPESAGAEPGPACYGRGGPVTVTDALVLLGRIPGDALAGGALPIDRAAAAKALGALGRSLRRAPHDAAAGVLTVADAHMEAALRKVSVERGHDPRDAALVAFGGAGGLHACTLAEALDARAVLFPRHAGVLSAVGALIGGARRERSRTVMLDAERTVDIAAALDALEHHVRAAFDAADRHRVRIERFVDVRYRGQSHELSIPAGPKLRERFHRAHEERFGFASRARAVDVVTAEVRGSVPGERPPVRGADKAGATHPARTRVWFGGRFHAARVLRRAAMKKGARIAGPAIVAEQGATLWVAPGWRGSVHASGTVVLKRGRR